MVKPDEDLDVAARRELEEETGLIFNNYYLVHIGTPTLGVEWFAYTFIATGYQGTKEKNLDAGEKNEVVHLSVEKVFDMTRKKEFYYQPVYIADLIVQHKIADLPDILKNPAKYSISL